jgi:hypothetical protein
MSAAIASAMILQCFFNPPSDGSVPTGSVPVIKVPVPAETAASLAAKEPPLSKNTFVGEAGGAREWVFGNSKDPAASSFQLLRVNLSEDALSASPYAARFGAVSKSGTGNYKFVTQMSGYCKLQTGNEAPK